ncbi:MAG TPA: DUF309 domain-containing protein [Planctomycetota bacterium]|nr:DUF309 domain-containing protein [Planctomycetota bacterium]
MDPYLRLRATAVWSRLVEGAQLCESGRWWHAHEAWEAAWKAYPGADRTVIQGLIQLTGANYHLERGNRRAARALLTRACIHLRDDGTWPFALRPLVAAAEGLTRAIDAGETPPAMAIDLVAALRAAEA